MRPTRPYGTWHELERLELGDRVAGAYDEVHEIAYRLLAAGGVARADAGAEHMRLQRGWTARTT